MIETQLSDSLGRLPASGAVVQELLPELKPDIAQTAARSLATRNPLRGRALDLSSGQDVARAMGIDPLTNEELFEDVEFDGDLLKVVEVTAGDVRKDLRDRAPLWFYILREAALEAGALTGGRSEIASSPRF
jgi:hypothetical protein